MSIFTGSAVALITPFHDGSVDFTAMTRLIELQIASGTDAIVALGTTGEAATLMEDEREEVIRFVVERVANRIPVIVGTGSNNTEDAIRKSRFAEAVGADGLLIVTPFYNKTSQEGLLAHYSSIAEQVRLPIIIYNVPSRTGLNIKPETVSKLVRSCENIVGIKEASGDISQITRLAAICPECDIYSGNDDQVVPIMSIGGKGVISTIANIHPEAMHMMCKAYFDGDVEEAKRLQLALLPLQQAAFCEVNPIPIKTMMGLLKLCDPEVRLPLVKPSIEHYELMENTLREYGML
ncbi:MAG: 4-hydroxy-tetrahydrodipicolinate synthase [Clostridia bacterium]|nr:4-hydroxy-tetrahydrodipicolinate synthase [Clostridia bacterium]MDO4835526.1 4-hydroxy-tetrahydrodipicolinate synthase [Clostridia bacterium]